MYNHTPWNMRGNSAHVFSFKNQDQFQGEKWIPPYDLKRDRKFQSCFVYEKKYARKFRSCFFSFTSIRRIFWIFIVFYWNWNWYQWKRILFRIFCLISHLSISIRDRATPLVNQANKITLEESFIYIVAENEKKRDMHVHFANTMTNQKYTSVFVIDRCG